MPVWRGGAGRDRFEVSDTVASLDRADQITDFGSGGEQDWIQIGRKNSVWIKREDANGDGGLDTVLYNNAEGNGGIYAILQDFTSDLTNDHFDGAASGFTIHAIV